MTPSAEPSTQPAAQAESAASAPRPPRLALLIATGFGLGYLPKAPGTWGSLGGVVLFAAMFLPPLEAIFEPHAESIVVAPFLPLAVLTLIGIWAAGSVSRSAGTRDPGIVVIDEISGQLITMLPVTLIHWHPDLHFCWEDPYEVSWKYLLAGFILFRVFDIWKPWPVRAAEKLPGGWGIMADDWVAGIYAALCLWGLRTLGL
jgi:phosphatidylglycerophosphatase A